MPKIFNLYVPAEYNFNNYFLLKINKPTLEHFEVDSRRHGIQRKGNNHLVVFLDFHGKKSSSRFAEVLAEPQGEFFMKSDAEVGLFNQMFGGQKEVAVYSVAFTSKMSAFAWKVLFDLVNDDRILVEDDTRKLMKGADCAKSLSLVLGQG